MNKTLILQFQRQRSPKLSRGATDAGSKARKHYDVTRGALGAPPCSASLVQYVGRFFLVAFERKRNVLMDNLPFSFQLSEDDCRPQPGFGCIHV